MAARFPGFSKDALKFFRQLERNNDRDWFEAHKAVYLESVKTPMEALVEAIGAEMTKWAPEYATLPGKAIYRIYRDTRFSSDKTPYKTHIGASFFRNDLGRHVAGGFYFEVSHRYVGVAAGTYMPEADNLRRMREHIVSNFERWEQIVSNRALKAALGDLQGEMLSRPPKGFPAEHPAVEWLKLKQMYYWVELPAAVALGPGLLEEVAGRFRKSLPVVEFLNEPLIAEKKKRAPLEVGWV